MKNSILFLVFLFVAFSLNAQDTKNFDALVDKISTCNCDRGSAKDCKEKAKKMLEDYIVKNEKEIQIIREDKIIADAKPVSKETAIKVANLYKEANNLINPGEEKPMSRGAGPSNSQWAHYFDWYRQDTNRLNLIPGFCLIYQVHLYQSQTGCSPEKDSNCMPVYFEYNVEAIANIPSN